METSGTLRATILFASTSLVVAVVIGAMLIGGWGGGVLDNRIEWLFWAGAILAGVGVGLLGLASIAVAEHGVGQLSRVGVGLFIVGPVLCIVAVFVDYWI